MSAVTVESIKPISNGGNLKASAILNIAGKLRINDIRIIQQQNQKPWVAMPSVPYERDGVRKWKGIIEVLDEVLKQQISDAVLSEFARLNTPSSAQAAR